MSNQYKVYNEDKIKYIEAFYDNDTAFIEQSLKLLLKDEQRQGSNKTFCYLKFLDECRRHSKYLPLNMQYAESIFYQFLFEVEELDRIDSCSFRVKAEIIYEYALTFLTYQFTLLKLNELNIVSFLSEESFIPGTEKLYTHFSRFYRFYGDIFEYMFSLFTEYNRKASLSVRASFVKKRDILNILEKTYFIRPEGKRRLYELIFQINSTLTAFAPTKEHTSNLKRLANHNVQVDRLLRYYFICKNQSKFEQLNFNAKFLKRTKYLIPLTQNAEKTVECFVRKITKD